MDISTELSLQRESFLELYSIGTVIETQITNIITPSQIVTSFDETFSGRLSVLDISWCLPEGEAIFEQYAIGQKIQTVIIDVDIQTRQIKLSQKHLTPHQSDSTTWSRIFRGDEFTVKPIAQLNASVLVKTQDGLYGLLTGTPEQHDQQMIRVRVNSKLDHANLLSFIGTNSTELIVDLPVEYKSDFNFIEDDLLSYHSFNRSVLGSNGSNADHDLIKRGFDLDPKIFSKEIFTEDPLYIQFELNSPAYENVFKQQAIPYFFPEETFNADSEKKVLDMLSAQHYWFKLNQFKKDQTKPDLSYDFSLYNDQINFHGNILISKDASEVRFVIRNFSIGQHFAGTAEKKKSVSKSGSFLYASAVVVFGPFSNLPLETSQKKIFNYLALKSECFFTINRLKKDSGEILRQEGRTLGIIDKFLEYQIRMLDDQKEVNIFVDSYTQVPSASGGIAIRISGNIGDALEFDGDTVVTIKMKQPSLKRGTEEELVKLSDGNLVADTDGYRITFFKDILVNVLKNGFYIEKRISKKQLTLQREIIQDFLEKKIKIDHIESLLVRPEKVRTPQIAKIQFNNQDLVRTEKEQPDNNQVKAVIKAVGNENIFLVQGPPGTGKTTVIAEIIEQLTKKNEKILVAGQNHVAVDNVLEKISKVPNLTLLRVGNPERIDKDLIKYNIDHLVEEYKSDFKMFLDNQVVLAELMLEAKLKGNAAERLLNDFSQKVKELSGDYGKLKDIYSQKHFVLRDGIKDLAQEDTKLAITTMRDWIDSIENEYEVLLKPMLYNSVDVVFATCIGIKTDRVFKDSAFKFDTVIIDEAGKANIAESLVAMELGKKVILVGDQMQLPPYMDSTLIDETDPESFPKSPYGQEYTQEEILHALKTSFFEFIINRIHSDSFPKENLELLNYQHRMHPNIGRFISESFYEGKVNMGSRTHLNRLDLPSPFDKEIVFFDTSNSKNPYEQKDGSSVKNKIEAETISEYILPALFNHNVAQSEIAIIAPYKSQVATIISHINNSTNCKLKNIDVSTLDSFQGKEYDIIIFSFTRAANHAVAPTVKGRKKFTKVGFLDDARRLNVAFSRAKKKLILIGNAVSLADRKSHYDGLFNYTQLFTNLIKLSKQEDIGNFYSVADFLGKSSFTNFTSSIFIGKKMRGTVGKLAVTKDKKEYGRFIVVDEFLCLAPYSHQQKLLNPYYKNLNAGQQINISIVEIDEKFKKVTVKVEPETWREKVAAYKIGDQMEAKIQSVTPHGFILRTNAGLSGSINQKQFSGRARPVVGDDIQVKLATIDYGKRQLGFKI